MTVTNPNTGQTLGSGSDIQSQYTLNFAGSQLGYYVLDFAISDSGVGAAGQSTTQTTTVTVTSSTQQPTQPSTSSSQAPVTPASVLSATVNPASSTPQYGQVQPIALSISGGTPPYTVSATDTDNDGGVIGSASDVQSTYTLQYGAKELGPDTITFEITDSGTGTAAQSVRQFAVVDVIPSTAAPSNPNAGTQPTVGSAPLSSSVSPQSDTITLGQTDTITVYMNGGTPPYSVIPSLSTGTTLQTYQGNQNYYTLQFTPTAIGYYTISFGITDSATGQNNQVSAVQVNPATTTPVPTPPSSQSQQTGPVLAVSPSPAYTNVNVGTQLQVITTGGTPPYTITVYDNNVQLTQFSSEGTYTYTYSSPVVGSHALLFDAKDANNLQATPQTESVDVEQQSATTPTKGAQPGASNNEALGNCNGIKGSPSCTQCTVYNSIEGAIMGTCTTCTYQYESTLSCDISQPDQTPRKTTTTGEFTTSKGQEITYPITTVVLPTNYVINNESWMQYSGGSAPSGLVSGGVANSVCTSYGLVETTATYPPVDGAPGYETAGVSGGYGYCTSTNNNQFPTTYSSTQAGSGDLSFQQGEQPVATPVVKEVLNQNAEDGQWLITCPDTPVPTMTTSYFSSDPTSFIGGDRCLTSGSQIQSNVILSVSANWALNNPATSQASVISQNFAVGSIEDLAYSGQTSDQGSSTSQISSGYDTQSYIFQQVPASEQHGLWSWQAKYANLKNANLQVLNQNVNINLDVAQYNSECVAYEEGTPCTPYYWYCIYPYTYTETAQVTNLQNTQIPVPTSESQANQNTLKFDGNTYPIINNGQTQLLGSCIDAMYLGGTDGGLYFAGCGSGWSLVSNQGTVSYDGNAYQNVNIYSNDQQYPNSYFAAYGLGDAVQATTSQVQTPTSYGSVGILPYMLYNVSLPATYSNLNGNEQFLNLSLDTYSAHNFLDPGEYLDAFPIYTDGGFFANLAPGGQGGALAEYPSSLVSIASPDQDAIASGATTLLSTFSPQQANAIGFGDVVIGSTGQQGSTAFPQIGRYVQGEIPNLEYLAATPNDYVYAINYTQACNWWTLCWTSTTNANLFVMRYIPTGDYNVSNDQPNAVGPTYTEQTTATSPSTAYGSYYGSYSSYPVTPVVTTTTTGTSLGNNQQAASASDVQNAWTAEWQGPQTQSKSQTQSTGYWANSSAEQSKNLYITDIYQLSNPTLSASIFNYFWSGTSGTGLFDIEPIAIGTDYGNDVYILGLQAEQGAGFDIAGIVWNPKDGSTTPVNGIVTQPQVTYTAGSQKGKQGNFIPSLPGEFAVSPGGQYVYVGNSTIGEIEEYSTYTTTSSARTPPYFTYAGSIPLSYSNSSYNMNIAAYLEAGGPFANTVIASEYANAQPKEVDDIESDHHPIAISESQGVLYVLDNWTFDVDNQQSSILMLRAFTQNGIEIPINPTVSDTMTPVNPVGVSSSPVITAAPVSGWPAYGFPISATIKLPDGSVQTYCAVACTTTPESQWLQGFGYYPIGPMIGQNGETTPGQQLNIGMSTDFNGTSYLIAHVSQSGTKYTELLAFHPTLVNYTKISLGADAQYVCYTDYSSSASPAQSNEGQSPCIQLAGSQATSLEDMYPPLLGVPSSFNFVESQGSPVEYLNAPGSLSSLIPSNLNSKSYQAQGYNVENNGFSGQPSYSQQNLQTGGYIQSTTGSSIGAPSAFPVVYANSVIRGYAVIPYTVSYSLDQQWSPNPDPGFSVVGNPGPTAPYPACTAYPLPNQETQTFVYDTYSVAPLQSSNFLNRTIEGGSIYAEYLPSNNYYIANISDKNAQLLPSLDINLFTNRVLGEYYINQTISSQSAYSIPSGYAYPMVLNATSRYNYQVNQYAQEAFGQSYPGYETQEAIPANVFGANCGGTCPSDYYYSSNPVYYLPTNNILSFANTISVQPIQLSQIFEFTTNIDNILLDMSQNPTVLGYNRLIYTYVDRFGNTYFMPLDVDLVNKTEITLSVATAVSPSNPNETTVTVNGVALSVSPLKTAPLPVDSLIDIYYDQNINYYNSISTGAISTQAGSYYEWAQQCAFAPIYSNSCQLADPTATLTQPGGESQAQLVNFYTQYNTIGSQVCAPEPNSLLTTPNYNECNIYGSFGLPATQIDPNTNSWEYCVPDFLNGNGVFTTQLGLVEAVDTNKDGSFSTTFNVCGTGANKVIAQYYGAPPPEPNYVCQTALSQSGGAYEFQSNLNVQSQTCEQTQQATGTVAGQQPLLRQTLEYGYTFAPDTSTIGVNVGNYALSIGEIDAIEVAAFIGVAAGVMALSATRKKHGRNGKRKRSRGR